MVERLFVYGTLHPDRAPAEIADVTKRLASMGKATVRGVRFDLGPYPALQRDAKTRTRVEGEVFALPDSFALARLDAYEAFDPKRPAKSLFRRAKATATFEDGTKASCWIYLYNRVVPKSMRASAASLTYARKG